MEKEVTLTRSDLVAIFKLWNQRASDGQWEDQDDPEASADYLLELAREI